MTIVERWPLVEINNCIAKMEVGCLEYPGASTIGSQPLDWNNAPMTGTTAQPSHEPPHERKGTGTHHTGTHQWRRQQQQQSLGRRGGRMAERTSSAEKTQHEGNLNAPNESHDRCSELLGMRIPKERWPLALKALLVVNSFKLHLNAFKLYDKT